MAPPRLQLCPKWLLLFSAILGAPSSAISLKTAREAAGAWRRSSSVADPEVDANPAAEESPGRTDKIRVLLFVAVGGGSKSMHTAIHNINALRSHSIIEPEVYMAHYDDGKERWLTSEGEWYKRSVDHSVESRGGKFLMAQKLLPEFLKSHFYDWIWLADEDVDFSHTNLTRMFLDAGRTEAFIVQPALRSMPDGLDALIAHQAGLQHKPGSVNKPVKASLLSLGSEAKQGCQPHEQMCNHLARHGECLFRYVNLVEVMTPIIRQNALIDILTACPFCIHERSVWGLDKMWCAWIAERNNKLDETGCAVLDRVTVFHKNLKTITKWDSSGNRRYDVINRDYWGALHDVRDHYANFFIPDLGHTHRCVPLDLVRNVTA